MKRRWRWLLRIGGLLALVALSVLLAVASGVFSIKASAGHFALTEWLLQLGKRRSIATHTIGLDLPPLDDPALVLRGAGHYETACRPCHGSPAHPRPRIAAAMLPPPPELRSVIPDRDEEALFYVVKHGIKFTGMPAWPTQRRDDEVHAMVAFLRTLPALDAAGYRRVVYGEVPASDAIVALRDLAADVEPPRPAIESCARCHGIDGRGRGNAAFPKLAGQRRDYLVNALAAYERERRHSGIMGPVAVGLTRDEQRALADYYSRLPAGPGETRDEARIVRGAAIAQHGIPAQDVPACDDCHGADGPRNAAYPRLAGQYADYLVLQLEVFARGDRGGSEYAHIMEPTARKLTAEQMRDVAAYYASR
jgi:cytochrome c553